MANSTLEQRRRSFGGGTREPSYLVDRFIVGLLLLAITAAAAMLVLAAAKLAKPSELFYYGAEVERWLQFGHLSSESAFMARLAVAVAAALVGLIALRLLYRRIVPPATQRVGGSHVLIADDKGIVEVEERGICTVAAEAVLRVNGVLEVEVETRGTGAGPIMLNITVWMHAAAEMKDASDAILHQAVTAVETLIGLEVYDSKVSVKVVPLEEMGRRVVD